MPSLWRSLWLLSVSCQLYCSGNEYIAVRPLNRHTQTYVLCYFASAEVLQVSYCIVKDRTLLLKFTLFNNHNGSLLRQQPGAHSVVLALRCSISKMHSLDVEANILLGS